MDLSKEEAHQLTLKYDVKNNGKFSYSDFLRNCVLWTKQPENTLLQRMKLQKPRIPMSTGFGGPLFVGCMVRIQPRILKCWRPMRRSFRSVDGGTGYICIDDFKQDNEPDPSKITKAASHETAACKRGPEQTETKRRIALISDMILVLRQYGVNLSEDEFFHILGFYDKDLSLKISYNDFLRSFLG